MTEHGVCYGPTVTKQNPTLVQIGEAPVRCQFGGRIDFTQIMSDISGFIPKPLFLFFSVFFVLFFNLSSGS